MIYLAMSILLAVGAFMIVVALWFPGVVYDIKSSVVDSLFNRMTLKKEPESERASSRAREDFLKLQLEGLLAYPSRSDAERLSRLRELVAAVDGISRQPAEADASRLSSRDLSEYLRKSLARLVEVVHGQVERIQLDPDNVCLDMARTRDVLVLVANSSISGVSDRSWHTSDLEYYFRRNPVSAEQLAELLQAVALLLLYREGDRPVSGPAENKLLASIRDLKARTAASLLSRAALMDEPQRAQFVRALGMETLVPSIRDGGEVSKEELAEVGISLNLVTMLGQAAEQLGWVYGRDLRTAAEEVSRAEFKLSEGRRILRIKAVRRSLRKVEEQVRRFPAPDS